MRTILLLRCIISYLKWKQENEQVKDYMMKLAKKLLGIDNTDVNVDIDIQLDEREICGRKG